MVLGKLPVPGRPTIWIVFSVSNFCMLHRLDFNNYTL